MKKRIGILLLILCIVLVGVFFLLKNPSTKIITLSNKYQKEEKGTLVEITSKELPNNNYILFTYNSYCKFPIPCDSVFQEFAEKEKIDVLKISFSEFRKSSLYPTVKYAPSVMVVEKDKVIAYLDPDKDEYTEMYQDVEAFTNWIKEYIEWK